MTHYMADKNGISHEIEEYGWFDGRVTLCIDRCRVVTLKVYYRPERTWNDHMGNTPCGYYANVPITKTERKRVYLNLYR